MLPPASPALRSCSAGEECEGYEEGAGLVDVAASPQQASAEALNCSFPLELLPEPELLQAILRWLPSEGLRNARQVCKDWRKAADSSVYTLKPKQFKSKGLVARFPNLEQLDLDSLGGVVDGKLKHLQELRNLRCLVLARNRSLTDAGLLHLSSLPMLTRLDLQRCLNVTDEGVCAVVQGCRQLKWLDLQWCYKVRDPGILRLDGLPALQHLNFSHLRHVTDAGLSRLPSLTCLTFLSISGCDAITDAGMATVGQLQMLQELDTCLEAGLEPIRSDATLAAVAQLTCLTSLHLSLGGPGMTARGMRQLLRLRGLKKLFLNRCMFVVDGTFCQQLLRHLRCLTHLALQDALVLDNEAVACLLTPRPQAADPQAPPDPPAAAPGLQKLALKHCPRLSDLCFVLAAAHAQIEPGPSPLASLSITCCSGIVGSGISALRTVRRGALLARARPCAAALCCLDDGMLRASCAPKRPAQLPAPAASAPRRCLPAAEVEEVDVGYCPMAGTRMVQEVVQLPALRKLDLSGCHVSDTMLPPLADASALTFLGLSDCPALRGDGFFPIRNMPALQILDLSFCKSFGDKGLQHVAQLPALQQLNLSLCTSITDLGLAWLIRTPPPLPAKPTPPRPPLPHLNISGCEQVSDMLARQLCQGGSVLHLERRCASPTLSDVLLRRI